MPPIDLKQIEFDQVLGDIASDWCIPGNLALTRTILKMQATINDLQSNQKLLQERVAELEGAQELP